MADRVLVSTSVSVVDPGSGVVVEDRPVRYRVDYRYDDPSELVEKIHYSGPIGSDWIDITGDERAGRIYSIVMRVLNGLGIEFVSLDARKLIARIANYVVSSGLKYKCKQMARAIAYIVLHNYYPWLLPKAISRLGVKPGYLFKHGLQRFLRNRNLWREAYEIGLRLLKQQGWSSLEPVYNLLYIEYRKKTRRLDIVPAGLAAGLLRVAAYIADKDTLVTQKLLSRTLGISGATIRTAERLIMESLGIKVLKTKANVVVEVIIPDELGEIKQYLRQRYGPTRVITVKLDEGLAEKLEEIAASTGVTKTDLIKQAIKSYMAVLGDR